MQVRGAVQGVGFRPFVYRLARSLELLGWVKNSPQGVTIAVQGTPEKLQRFLQHLQSEKPPMALIQNLEYKSTKIARYSGFEIRHSKASGTKEAYILPDIATCEDCLSEINDTQNRRYRYPFTNCTNCGPRFSIIEALPYDRPNTSMKSFIMCADCSEEYEDPANRRFHAQPNACPVCGPQLALWNNEGKTVAERDQALLMAAAAIANGQIIALKGIGGFQLLVDARNNAAVERLRRRKQRPEKPFALMYLNLASVQAHCRVSKLEAQLLKSPQAPIVLLRKNVSSAKSSPVSPAVAPNNPNLGIMLPGSPLHHLLLQDLNFPVVASSGNLADEPICIDNQEALRRLQGIADFFLVHNRPIIRHVDDSIVREVLGTAQMLRRARGYAPLPLQVPEKAPPLLAVGAHLKNTIALAKNHSIFISQHIGDLESLESLQAFHQVIGDFQQLYETKPRTIVCDMHPDYLSTQFALENQQPVMRIQHHYAHVGAAMLDNQLSPPVLGVSWDGTGFGPDNSIWGGEFFIVAEKTVRRIATLRQFRLPGGEAAIRQPRRSAAGILFEIAGEKLFETGDLLPFLNFTDTEEPVIRQMLTRGMNAPLCSSAGRLFDAVASLAGLRQNNSFEGQAAMDLEFAIRNGSEAAYSFAIVEKNGLLIDWQPMIEAIVKDLREGKSPGQVSARFHNTLAEIILSVAQKAALPAIVLSGGCFQNKYLTERTVARLRDQKFQPYWHQNLPPNDGGIAAGQIMAAWKNRRFIDEMVK